MSGLILEIQKSALDESVSVETLLRRMKLAAAKLQLSELEVWVENELNGYKGDPPDYRTILGNPSAWNPINGWIPIHAPNEQLMELFSTAHIRQTIGSLDDLLRNHTSGPLNLPMPIGVIELINSMANYSSARMVHQISRGVLVTILSKVRNMVLDWAIEMEKSGVIGEGLTFSLTEKTHAKEVMATINIETFTGILGSNNNSGDINSGTIIKNQLEEIVEKLRKAMPALIEAGADSKKLPKAIKNIENEISRKKPKPKKIREFLEDTNQAIIGASGSLIADGAKAIISSLVAML